MSRFNGKTAVVTGAGSGMGRQIAIDLAKEGAVVAALDVREDSLTETVSIVRGSGGKADAFTVDLGSSDSIATVVRALLQAYDGIDVLINNAGVFDQNADLLATDEALWDRINNVNVKAPFLLSRALMPALQTSPSGAIVNIASIAGLGASSGGVAYTASKHAVLGLTKSIAATYATQVRCNAVLPGAIMTAMTRELFEEGTPTHEGVLRSPIARYAEADEVARVALFLASDEASFMIGAHVVVDGGWSII